MKKYLYLKLKGVIALIIIFLLSFPFSLFNINLSKLLINNKITLDISNLIVSILLIIYLIVNIIIKFNKNESKNSKIFNYVFDNIIIISIYILLSSKGYLIGLIPIIILVNFIINFMFNNKEKELIKLLKLALSFTGIFLILNNDLPFSLLDLNVHYFIFIVIIFFNLYDILNFIFSNIKFKNKSEELDEKQK